ncbi:hypothetical protein AB3K92_17995 [Burkholderia sp. Bmkn7]|uniref:hypothetical protein n=1 Tax=Burkholderia sp. Bmkn7 TaxID=3236841 RepID=UPI0034E4BC56
MRIDADATTVGTARVRDSWAAGRSSAARQIAEHTGVRPPSDFDDIASGFNPGAPVPQSMQKPKHPPKYRNRKCEHEGNEGRFSKRSRQIQERIAAQIEREQRLAESAAWAGKAIRAMVDAGRAAA